MLARVRAADDRGETLLELIIAIMILGVLVVAVGSGIAVSVKVSGLHRMQSTAGAFLHNYAETLQGAGTYTKCTASSTPNYASALAAPPDGSFNDPSATVVYWDSATGKFGASTGCPAAGDPGLQQVTLQLASKDGLVTESLVVVIRDQS